MVPAIHSVMTKEPREKAESFNHPDVTDIFVTMKKSQLKMAFMHGLTPEVRKHLVNHNANKLPIEQVLDIGQQREIAERVATKDLKTALPPAILAVEVKKEPEEPSKMDKLIAEVAALNNIMKKSESQKEAKKENQHSIYSLSTYECHVMTAQANAEHQLRINAPHERVLSAKYIWDHLRANALAWANRHKREFGAGFREAFIIRMAVNAEASLKLSQDSKARPEYRQQRRVELLQHDLDPARAQQVADARAALELAQQALEELEAQPCQVVRAEDLLEEEAVAVPADDEEDDGGDVDIQ